MINILAITRQFSSVGYHRVTLPMTYMKDRFVRVTDTLTDEAIDRQFDILLVNRYADGYELDELLKFKEKHNLKLVVDIDDYWDLDQWHILKQYYPTKVIIDHLYAADGITVASKLLADDVIRKLNIHKSKVCYIPNALPYGEDQFTDVKEQSEKVRIGYAGGTTHEQDLKLIAGSMKRLQSDTYFRNHAEVIFSGFTDRPIWHRMATYFKGGYSYNFRIQPAMDVYSYMNLYNTMDIAVAPLVPSYFNNRKSNLKVLEAAAKKIPIVVSNTPPYDICDEAIQAYSSSDWFYGIKRLVKDAIYREEKGLANYEWCVKHHNLHDWNEARHQFYSKIIN